MERLCALASCCHQLGNAALIIGSVRGRFSDADSKEAYYQNFEDSMREVVSYCEPYEVPVILEVIEQADADSFRDAEETSRFTARLASPALHMYLDVMHLHSEGYDVAETIRSYGRESFQIDISGEKRLSPRQSSLDFPAICAAVLDSGFDRNLAFEYHADDPRGDLAYVKDLLSRHGEQPV